jgi:hypothetical protein
VVVVKAVPLNLNLFGLYVLTHFSNYASRLPVANALLATLFVQVMLGVFTYMKTLLTGDRQAQGALAEPIRAAHLAMGALLSVAMVRTCCR